jgi:hypothetical protein
LGPALEQVQQRQFAARPREAVVLGDLDHRQPATGGVDRIAVPGQLAFLREQLAPRCQPLITGRHVRIGHVGASLSRRSRASTRSATLNTASQHEA